MIRLKCAILIILLALMVGICFGQDYITILDNWYFSNSGFSVPTIVDYAIFTGTSQPTAVAGGMYRHTSGVWYVCKDGSNWTELATGAAGSLDGAYDEGTTITVDSTVVALTSTDALNAAVLAIDQVDTGAYNAFTLVSAATKAVIDLDQNGSGGDIDGTDDYWSVSKVGAFVIKGSLTFETADVLFDSTSAGKDIQFDEDAQMLHFLDAGSASAILGFGGSADSGADISFIYDGGNNDLDITGSGKEIAIGATGGAGMDLVVWGESGKNATFTGASSELVMTDYDIWLDDDAVLFIGGTKVTGFYMEHSSSKTMALLAGANSDDFAFNIGVDQSGIDVGMYGTTPSAKLLFDSGNDALIFDAIDLHMGDEDIIQFGDSTDAVLSYDATKDQLEYRELTTGDEAKFQIVGGEGKEGRLILAADDDDDATDQWEIAASITGTLTFGNDASADTFTDKFTIAHTTGNITLTGDIINENGDTIIMSNDDKFTFTSDDDNVTILVLGHANAKSAILDLSADAANDNDDTWTHTVADGGAYTIACEGTATLTIDEAVDMTGTITLADNEILSNTGDIVDITGDDGDTTFAIRGYTGNFSAILEISADDAADAVDTWLFTVVDGGALTIANDGTATMAINEVVAFGSGTTIADVVVTNGTYTVTVVNSGKIHIILDLAGNTSIDLPSPADGLNYEFWYCGGAEEAHDHMINTGNDTNWFIGGVIHHDNDDGSVAAISSNGSSNSKFTISDMRDGTRVKVTCDGTYWYITGTVNSDTVPGFANQT